MDPAAVRTAALLDALAGMVLQGLEPALRRKVEHAIILLVYPGAHFFHPLHSIEKI